MIIFLLSLLAGFLLGYGFRNKVLKDIYYEKGLARLIEELKDI